ncbi:TIGR03084 family protein [Corynebacterium sp. TAE3-ERU12]|uniref:TIGR03084 family metal-binding protein n=1 Tax=Corynebacterium sp. TAE3-ERU12 TaxID=2849491 RepID=UPI001C469624|nr:TIGR03084 family metal-binding protein [Corynebacterium sp. TAE3-ERU12]MBV7294784.1 TIGR03084 family protein [Corynebacterium sp. TAE3-ERU12]
MNSKDPEYSAAVDRLRREGLALENLVASLSDDQWQLETPAVGWTIAHQIGHLWWTDGAALAALGGAEEFAPYFQDALSRPFTLTDDTAAEATKLGPAELLTRWRTRRNELAEKLENADLNERYPWFGPPMRARSMVTARIMETWAHGQDIYDTVGSTRPASAALRDISHLGVITQQFCFQINELAPPEEPVRVEVHSDGETWSWGPEDATNRITGSATDFCLMVTQRRELDELDLDITGPVAAQWAEIAQAFAGPPKSVVRAQQHKNQ